jgi:hypothetical protein
MIDDAGRAKLMDAQTCTLWSSMFYEESENVTLNFVCMSPGLLIEGGNGEDAKQQDISIGTVIHEVHFLRTFFLANAAILIQNRPFALGAILNSASVISLP